MNRTALITGGMGGIGSAVAQAAAAQGYNVVLLYHQATAESVDVFLTSLPEGNHHAYQVDMRDPASIEATLALVQPEYGTLDLVVHTASERITRSTIEAMSPEVFAQQFSVAVFGAFSLFKEIIPLMKEHGGLVVGITTSFIDPSQATTRMPGYISAKYALRGLLREFATEMKPYKVRVNAVAPDLLQTEFSSDLPPRFFEWAAERDPRGRVTTVSEVADKIMFLTTPEGEGYTGLSFHVASDHSSPL